VRVNAVMLHDQITWRQQKLQHIYILQDDKNNLQRDELHLLLLEFHRLSEDDRGETDVQMKIETGNVPP